MKIDKDSLEILNKSEIPALFRVDISDNTVSIQEIADDKIYGNILVYAEDVDLAFELAIEYKDILDYLFFYNASDKSIKTIAKPEEISLSVDEIFQKIGNISDGFEKREEQINLSKKIEHCLENKKNGIFEAPTGTGKSIAYLIPAILHAKRNKQRVVVSTNTINLQRQLIEKDLPILESIIKFKARVALGRANYLCKRKLDLLFEKGNIFLFEGGAYEKLKNFSKASKNGIKSEFFDTKNDIDESLWDSVSSSSLTCAHTKCPYYKNRCFYYKAKAALDSADLIIANHHIVLSDAIMKEAKVLPEYEAIIFDEAHNLEKNATNYFTQTVSTSEITRLLNSLYSNKKGKKLGFIVEIPESSAQLETIETIKNTKKIIEDITSYFQHLKNNEITVNDSNISDIDPWINTLISALLNLYDKLKMWKENVDISAIAQTIKENAEILNMFLDINDTQNIKWIKKAKNYVHFNITPISVKDSLRENIYANTSSVIFTSATISVNGSFDFFKRTIGIDNAYEFIAENNFDYDRVSKLVLIRNAPQPNSDNYIESLTKTVINLANAINGGNLGVLILFTSYKMLNELYDKTHQTLEDLGFNTLKQGDFDNFATLKEFKKNKSFLFATSSFWEGIDVKGEALSVVFITRLPFEVPSTPIENSRYEIMKKEGINAFLEYSLPKAVLKFRQGFGRLIRDKKDKGVIIVSDSRIIHKSYGKIFMDALPKIKKEVIKTDEIKSSVCGFFGLC